MSAEVVVTQSGDTNVIQEQIVNNGRQACQNYY